MNFLSVLVRVPFLLTLLIVVGCANAEPRVKLKDQTFNVLLAQTGEEQRRGLMFVEEMPRDQGMLFIFNDSRPRAFWMKNTRIALDILYFDESLRLVSMAKNARPCVADPCPSYPSGFPARYVLELNAGQANSMGLLEGDQLQLLFQP